MPKSPASTRKTLRSYQEACVQSTWDYFRNHPEGNPLFVVPTRGGKSLIMAETIRRAIEAWPETRVMVLTHVKELIEQNYQEFVDQWGEGIFCPAGIYSAGIGRREARAQVLFAGIQTVWNKVDQIGSVDLVFVDEVHLVPKRGMGRYVSMLASLREANPRVRFLGYTATHYRLDGGYLHVGDDRIFTDVAYEIRMEPLVEQGYLVPLVAKKVENEIDMRGVRIEKGEFKLRDMEESARGEGCVEAAVAELVTWARKENRKCWIIFASGVNHAKDVLRELREVHGVTAEAVFGNTPSDERSSIVARFKRGEITALVNCQVLCLDAETEILTSSGWVGIDGMTPEHEVAAWDADGSIRMAPPEMIVRRNRSIGERMVSISGRNHNIRVTGNHRIVNRRGEGRWRIDEAESVCGKDITIPVSGECDPQEIEVPAKPGFRTSRAARIRVLSCLRRKSGLDAMAAKESAIEHVDRIEDMKYAHPTDLSIDECAFIGFWLGDGTLGGGRCEITQSKSYPWIIEWIDNLLLSIKMPHSRHEMISNSVSSGFVRWSCNRGTGGLSQSRYGGYFRLTPYLDKAGSNLLWGLGREQLMSLLYGFWLADGNHGDGRGNKSRGKSITGTQIHLYEKLQAIGACRGLRCTLWKCPAPQRGHSQQWTFRWKKQSSSRLMRERLEIETEWRDERVWCVTSVTGKIVTRRRGKVAVLGNTTGFNAPRIDLLAMMRATQSAALYVQVLGRGMTPFPEKSECLVLDYGGNVERHGPINRVKPKHVRADGSEKPPPPMKACPQCKTMVMLGVGQCPSCFYRWPENAMREEHARVASYEAPFDPNGFQPRTLRVANWFIRRHKAKVEGKPDTMRVDYMCGMHIVSAWVCIGHPSQFARGRAADWWVQHGGSHPIPATVDEAIGRQEELRLPPRIEVVPEGKYERVKRPIYEFANEESPT